MTKNGLDIQTVSTERTDFQVDYVLLLEQGTEKKERKNRPFAFFKISFSQPARGTFGFAPPASRPFAKPKERFFATAQNTTCMNNFDDITNLKNN